MTVEISLRDLGWAHEVRLSGVGRKELLETVGQGIASALAGAGPTVVDIDGLTSVDAEGPAALLAAIRDGRHLLPALQVVSRDTQARRALGAAGLEVQPDLAHARDRIRRAPVDPAGQGAATRGV